jgi:hypothetical protein
MRIVRQRISGDDAREHCMQLPTMMVLNLHPMETRHPNPTQEGLQTVLGRTTGRSPSQSGSQLRNGRRHHAEVRKQRAAQLTTWLLKSGNPTYTIRLALRTNRTNGLPMGFFGGC